MAKVDESPKQLLARARAELDSIHARFAPAHYAASPAVAAACRACRDAEAPYVRAMQAAYSRYAPPGKAPPGPWDAAAVRVEAMYQWVWEAARDYVQRTATHPAGGAEVWARVVESADRLLGTDADLATARCEYERLCRVASTFDVEVEFEGRNARYLVVARLHCREVRKWLRRWRDTLRRPEINIDPVLVREAGADVEFHVYRPEHCTAEGDDDGSDGGHESDDDDVDGVSKSGSVFIVRDDRAGRRNAAAAVLAASGVGESRPGGPTAVKRSRRQARAVTAEQYLRADRERFQAAARRLLAAQRPVFEDYYVRHLSDDETAERNGMTPTAVRKMAARIRQHFADAGMPNLHHRPQRAAGDLDEF